MAEDPTRTRTAFCDQRIDHCMQAGGEHELRTATVAEVSVFSVHHLRRTLKAQRRGKSKHSASKHVIRAFMDGLAYGSLLSVDSPGPRDVFASYCRHDERQPCYRPVRGCCRSSQKEKARYTNHWIVQAKTLICLQYPLQW